MGSQAPAGSSPKRPAGLSRRGALPSALADSAEQVACPGFIGVPSARFGAGPTRRSIPLLPPLRTQRTRSSLFVQPRRRAPFGQRQPGRLPPRLASFPAPSAGRFAVSVRLGSRWPAENPACPPENDTAGRTHCHGRPARKRRFGAARFRMRHSEYCGMLIHSPSRSADS